MEGIGLFNLSKVHILYSVDPYIDMRYTCQVIKTFKDQKTVDLFNGTNSKEARKIPRSIWNIVFRKLDQINAAAILTDLKAPPGNRLESLSGDLKGYHSIRINDQYRVVFKWSDDGAEEVEVTDYH
jgi:proteic killer suppression protein